MPIALLILVTGLLGGEALEWTNPPRMHNPTQTSVQVAAIPAVDAEIQITWGDGHKSPVTMVRAGRLFCFEVTGLQPGRVALARVKGRVLGESEWTKQHKFKLRTLPAGGKPVRFALMADTHAWALYSKKEESSSEFLEFGIAMKNVWSDKQLDFGVVLTDSAMTRCGNGCLAAHTPLGATTAMNVESEAEALVRYRMTWGLDMLGAVARRLPLLTLNGDHEGELGWLGQTELDWSRSARERTIPALGQGYIAGPPGTQAYALQAGAVLIVMLDVHSLTRREPTVPEHWRLGQAQHEWLYEVLASSRQPWKVVMAEHVLGGVSDPTLPGWKGRGSIKATADGTPTGTFLGEQALVHKTMLATGADLFVSAHDHVVAWGSKDGVHYLTAGRAGGIGHPWIHQPFFREVMDFDGDGVPEYETDVTGTVEPGHVVLTVDQQRLLVEYVRASPNFAVNQQVLLSYELER